MSEILILTVEINSQIFFVPVFFILNLSNPCY